MKKVLALILALVMVFALCACGAESAAPKTDDAAAPAAPEEPAAEVIELRLSSDNSPTDPICNAMYLWSDAVKEATNGGLIITVYPSAQLGDAETATQGCELGSIDIVQGDTGVISNWVADYGLTALPFIVADYEEGEVMFYESDIVKNMDAKLLEEYGMRALGWGWNGFRQFATKTPLTDVASCKNIKMRCPQIDIYIKMYETLGMNPTIVSWNDAYTAIQSGLADGLCCPAQAIYDNGFHKLCTSICRSNHMLNVCGPVINEKVFQSLPEEYQTILQDEWIKVRDEYLNPTVSGSEDEYFAKFEAEGCTVTSFENKQEIIDLFKPVWEEEAEENGYTDSLFALYDAFGIAH